MARDGTETRARLLAEAERLFAEVGIPATFYCVAEDLELEDNRDRVRAIAAAGHEVGNHTWRHPYDLTRMSAEQMYEEIGEGKRLLEAATGVSAAFDNLWEQ